MRRPIFLALMLMLLATAPALAELGPTDQTAIQAVIQHQLDAFQADDGEAAFSFASPSIQEQFVTPENFLALVRHAYPMVYRPRETHFGVLDEEDGQIVQKVAFVGPDGVLVTALYIMEREPDGSWRIAGCIIAKVPTENV
jgi:hypothetical protein